MSVDDQLVTTENPEATFNDLLTYTELLNTPSLARLYIFILRTGTVDIDTIKDDLEMPHSTTYKYIGQLEEMGILTRHDDESPSTVSVEPIHLELDTSHGEIAATPVLVDAISRQIDTEDIRIFLNRQGIAKIAAALYYTQRIMNGELTQRTAANKLGVHPVEGITVITALRDVVEEAAAYDPYLEQHN
jgi:hypothetical protein